MDGLTRTENDVTWITNGIAQIIQFQNSAGAASIYMNVLFPKRIAFSSICDWNLILTADNHPYNGQCYATKVAFNIEICNDLFCNQDEILTCFE
jgi:phage-related protein